jgi:DNA-binding transcriptional MerR regulator
MLRIGDFSKLGQVSIHTLRHYDDIGLLKPEHIDAFTDYRYYTLEQLPRLNRILALKDLGFSLEQIARLIDDNIPVEQMKGMLRMRLADIERQIDDERTRLMRVARRLTQIEAEGKPSPYDVTMKRIDAVTLVSRRALVPGLETMARHRRALYDAVYSALDSGRIKANGPEIALYHNTEYTETDIDTECGIAINAKDVGKLAPVPVGVTTRTLPASEETVSVMYRGAMIDVTQAIVAAFSWIDANGYECAQHETRELHHFGRERELATFDAPVVLELQVAVRPIR